jgi:hypothetical protein
MINTTELPPQSGVDVKKDVDGDKETKPEVSEWTIMIYMSGDNDLAQHCIRSLTEMKSLAAIDPRKIRVTAQIDPEDARMETRRLVINRKDKGAQTKPGEAATPSISVNGGPGKLDDDKIGLGPGKVRFPRGRQSRSASATATQETNMADPETLFDFISRSKDECPAENYMLVLDGHASGIEEGFLLKDQNPPGSMSLTDLKTVLTNVRDLLDIKLDILGMDSCLMNMIEISYEFQGVAEIIVGSQGLVPGNGWPYARIFGELAQAQTNGKVGAADLAAIIVRTYINAYIENSIIGGLSVDVGAFYTARSSEVAVLIQSLAELLTDNLMTRDDLKKLLAGKLEDSDRNIVKLKVMDELILSHWRAQSFNGELFVDLWDFCDLLKRYYSASDEIYIKCGAVQSAVEMMMVQSCFSGIEYQHAHGISIYFPWSEMLHGYSDLDFAQSSLAAEAEGGKSIGWSEFLKAYLHVTRRETRGKKGLRFLTETRKNPPWKRDPPYHGPYEAARSMRNPPREYPRITDCIRDVQKFNRFLETFGFR